MSNHLFIRLISILLLSTPFAASAEERTLNSVNAGEVLIERDGWGIPHIYGQSLLAVAFGGGYAQAEDHLDAMLRLFLKARGELSRVEGTSALKDDILERTLMNREIVERTWDTVPQSSRDYYQAFADGINRYIETHAAEKQPWYWKVGAQDIATYLRLTVVRDGMMIVMEKMASGGAQSPEASNGWAISASRSASGHAMLHADPHLPWSGEHRFGYEQHLKCPEMNVAGAMFFGVPVPMIGHNANIAWTVTNNAANTADIFEEKIDPQNPDRYLDSDGQWKSMEKRIIHIEVRQADGSMKSVEEVLRYTRRGPYIENRGHGYSIALARWKDFPDPMAGFIHRATAGNLKEFRASLAEDPLDKYNIMYADREGNILYVDDGVFPKRGAGFNYNQPVPGWEAGAQWNDYVAFQDLPQFANPPGGIIVQCNNSPYSTAQPPVLDPANFSPYLVHSSELTNPASTRAGRSFEVLDAHPKISWDDFRQAALDLKVLNADPLLRTVLEASEGQTDPDLREVHSILQSWDHRATVDNSAWPILKYWNRLAQQQKVGLNPPPSHEEALAILKQAVAEMKQRYGKVSVTQGEVQVFSHGKEYPVPGAESLFLVNAAYKNGKWYANGGSSWLMLVELGTPMKVLTVAPQGESDHRLRRISRTKPPCSRNRS